MHRSKCSLAFRGLPHNPQSVLTAVHRLTLVCVELLLNFGFIGRSERSHGGKLHVAVFADAELWGFAHDPKVSLCHAPSLRRPCWRSSPVEIKRHHYRSFGKSFGHDSRRDPTLDFEMERGANHRPLLRTTLIGYRRPLLASVITATRADL